MKEQKLLVQTEEEIDPLERQPFAIGVEALIATIDDKEELIKAITESARKRF